MCELFKSHSDLLTLSLSLLLFSSCTTPIWASYPHFRGLGDGSRGYISRQRFRGREEGLHRPSEGLGAGEAVPGAMSCNNIYVFIKDDVNLSMHLSL